MKQLKWLAALFLINISVGCWGQVKTKITDPTISSVLDKFIQHLKDNGESEHAVIRLKMTYHSVVPGIKRDALADGRIYVDSTDLTQWDSFTTESAFFLSNERMNSTLDLKIPAYYAFYKGIPVLFSSGTESLVEPDPKAVARLKQVLVKHFMPQGLLPVSSVWFVYVKNKKFAIQKIF